MRVLLAAVNAKYIHTSLSVRALAAYADSPDVSFAEFTINERVEDVLKRIYLIKADSVLFSCYIWNIGFVLKVAGMLKKVSPKTEIILGGPEVSFDSRAYMQKYGFIDGIMRGEGEEIFADYLRYGKAVNGITYRSGDKVVEMPGREPVCSLDRLPFPYTDEDIAENRHKLIYYESSRGCPFRCSYCLSSTVHNVRFRNTDIVKQELKRFIDGGVRIVKFVDRTFNADRRRAAELIRFLADQDCETQFHFEIAADLINDEITDILRSAPKNRFLLEIGVQSTNMKTLEAIDRKADFMKITETVRKLKGAVHMHLDLIAGLPYEDYVSFARSFDEVMALDPDVLQLGFLKLLRGTKIRREYEKHGYVFEDEPPYEVLFNSYISYEELLKLHSIESVFEKYHNSGVFKNALSRLSQRYTSQFVMYSDLAEFFEMNGYSDIGISQQKLYAILAEFCGGGDILDYIKLDYFINTHNPSTPEWALSPYNRSLLRRRFEILSETFISERLPEYIGKPVKEMIKSLWFEEFDYDVLGNGEKRKNIIIFDKKYNRIVRA